jgi:hypothetical protein
LFSRWLLGSKIIVRNPNAIERLPAIEAIFLPLSVSRAFSV